MDQAQIKPWTKPDLLQSLNSGLAAKNSRSFCYHPEGAQDLKPFPESHSGGDNKAAILNLNKNKGRTKSSQLMSTSLYPVIWFGQDRRQSQCWQLLKWKQS